MSPLGTARRFVRKQPRSFELVGWKMIRRRLKGAGVIGTRNAIAAVSTAIEYRLKAQSTEAAILCDAKLGMHQHGMAAAMTVEHLFTRERDLNGPAGLHREFGNCNLVAEGIALPSEASAIGTRNDLNSIGGHLQHSRK